MESLVTQTSDASSRFRKVDMLHKVQKMLLERLNCNMLSGISTTWKDGITRTCLPSPLSYCFEISEGCDMYCIFHYTWVKRPCLMCLFSLNDIQNLRTGQLRMITDKGGATSHGVHISIISIA